MNNNSPTRDDLKTLIKELRKATGSFGKLTDAVDGIGESSAQDWRKVYQQERQGEKQDADREKRRKKAEKEDRSERVERSTKGVISKFKLLEGSSEGATGALSGITKYFLGGAVGLAFDEVAGWGKKVTGTYQSLVDSGQTFSGGLLDMSKDAAASGMSMQKYAEFLTKNSDLAARFKGTGTGLADMAKSVRKATLDMGQYGYSVDGLNDLTADYIRRQVNFGRSEKDIREMATDGVRDLAQETTGLAKLFGKSRQQITSDASNAMNNSTFIVMMQQRAGKQFAEANDAIQQSITMVAALPGEAGKALSDMLAETMATGTSVFNKHSQDFIQSGMGEAVGLMDQAGRDMMAKGANREKITADLNNHLIDYYEQNSEKLKLLAMAGNQSAINIIQMMKGYKRVSEKDILDAERNAAVKDKFTAQMNDLDHKWGDLMGRLANKFLPVLGLLTVVVGKMIDGLLFGLDVLDKGIGGIENVFSGITSMLNSPMKAAIGFGAVIAAIAGAAIGVPAILGGLGTAGLGVIGSFGIAGGAVRAFAGMFLKLGKIIPTVLGGLMKGGLKMVGLGGLGEIITSGFKGKDFTINAAHVTVNGFNGGFGGSQRGGSGGPGSHMFEEGYGPHKPGEPKKGWFGRMGDKIKGRGRGGKIGGALGLLAGALEMGDVGMSLFGHKSDAPETPETGEGKTGGVATPVEPQAPKVEEPESKIGGAVKAAEHIAEEPKWMGFMKSTGKLVGKVTGVLGKVQLAVGAYRAVGGMAEYLEGKKSFGEMMKDTVKGALPAVMGTVGAAIGGVAGAAGGTLIAPGVGTAVGEVAGNMAGWSAGEALADKLLNWFGMSPDASPSGPKAASQENLDDELIQAKKELAEYRKTHEGKNNDDLIKKIGELQDKLTEQTRVIAIKNNEQIDQTKKLNQAITRF